jgi:hypothetical protein
MEDFKSLINYISNPTILVTAVIIIFPFVFPPTNWFYKINKRLNIDKLWTGKGLLLMMLVTVAFFIFGLTDYNFRSIVLKPDNVPISGLILLLIFSILSWMIIFERWALLSKAEEEFQDFEYLFWSDIEIDKVYDIGSEKEVNIVGASEKYWPNKRRTFLTLALSQLNSSFLNESHNQTLNSHVFQSIDNCIENNKLNITIDNNNRQTNFNLFMYTFIINKSSHLLTMKK